MGLKLHPRPAQTRLSVASAGCCGGTRCRACCSSMAGSQAGTAQTCPTSNAPVHCLQCTTRLVRCYCKPAMYHVQCIKTLTTQAPLMLSPHSACCQLQAMCATASRSIPRSSQVHEAVHVCVAHRRYWGSMHKHHNPHRAGNIWLHFAPSFVAWWVLLSWLMHLDAPHSDAFLRMVVPALACLLLSTAYHLFMAQVKHYRFWLTADVRTHSRCNMPGGRTMMLLHYVWMAA